MKRFILLLLVLSACQKDAQTVLDGTYQVTTNDLPATITINGLDFNITGQAWGSHHTSLNRNGSKFNVNSSVRIKYGQGEVDQNDINGYLCVKDHLGREIVYFYEGSK